MRGAAREAFVLHPSVALAALLGDEAAEAADPIIARIGVDNAIAPAHFGLEIAGLVARQVRIGALDESVAIALAREAATWPLDIDTETAAQSLNRTLALALAHRLAASEAAYLEICLRRAAALATFDPRLATIARIHAVRLLIPIPA